MTLLTAALRVASRSLEAEGWDDLLRPHADSAGLTFLVQQVRNVARVLSPTGSRPGGVRIDAQLFHIDLTTVCLSSLWMEAKERGAAGIPVFVLPPAREQLIGRATLLFEAILVNLTNNLLAFRSALSRGLDFPARTLLRSQIELGTILQAFVADDVFQGDYLAWVHDVEDSVAHWAKVRPKVAQRCVLIALEQSGLDSATVATVKASLRYDYAWLSGYEHGNVIAMVAAAHSQPTQDPNAPSSSALGGAVGIGTRRNAHLCVQYAFHTLIVLFHFLCTKHGWARRKDDHVSAQLGYILRFHQIFSIELLRSLENVEKTEVEEGLLG